MKSKEGFAMNAPQMMSQVFVLFISIVISFFVGFFYRCFTESDRF
jgi:hypothetical protein